MTRTSRLLVAMMLGALIAIPLGLQAQSKADVALRAAIENETVKGDLKAAIEQYKVLADGADRAVAAKALVRLGECYQKLGNTESTRAWERVVRDFVDQKEAVAEARGFLSASTGAAGSGLLARQVVWISDRQFGGAISRDGRYMAFTNQSRDVGVYDIAAGVWRRVLTRPNESAAVGFALISPDGQYIAYALFDPPSGPDTYLVGVNGSSPHRLPGAAAGMRRVPWAWSPDGRSILIGMVAKGQSVHAGQAALVSTTDGTSKVIGAGFARGCISPDGRYVALQKVSPTGDREGIAVYAADGSGELSLVPGPYDLQLWAHDGRRLLVTKERGTSSELWAVPMNAGKASGVPIFIKEESGGLHAASPAGEYYYTTRSNSRVLYTAEFDPRTGRPTAGLKQVSSGDQTFGAAWSPDGEWLAYYAYRKNSAGSSRFVVVIRSSRTGEERELEGRGVAEPPALRPQWFPDSRSLFIHKHDGSLHRIDVATGESTPLVEQLKITPYRDKGPFPFYFSYVLLAPDGRTIYYLARHADTNQTVIMRRSLDGGPETQVSRFAVNGIPGLSISPDGLRLVYVSGHPGDSLAPDGSPVLPDPANSSSLWTVPTAGGTPTLLFKIHGHSLHDPAWSADGRFVFVLVDYQGGDIAMIPSGGGEATMMGVRMTMWYYLAVHPDGRQIAVVDERINNYLWVMKHLFPAEKPAR